MGLGPKDFSLVEGRFFMFVQLKKFFFLRKPSTLRDISIPKRYRGWPTNHQPWEVQGGVIPANAPDQFLDGLEAIGFRFVVLGLMFACSEVLLLVANCRLLFGWYWDYFSWRLVGMVLPVGIAIHKLVLLFLVRLLVNGPWQFLKGSLLAGLWIWIRVSILLFLKECALPVFLPSCGRIQHKHHHITTTDCCNIIIGLNTGIDST